MAVLFLSCREHAEYLGQMVWWDEYAGKKDPVGAEVEAAIKHLNTQLECVPSRSLYLTLPYLTYLL